MADTIVATVTKMIEVLPEPVQRQVAEHMREYIEDLRDELHWDAQFESTGPSLVEAAKKAREEIKQGLSKPMDVDDL